MYEKEFFTKAKIVFNIFFKWEFYHGYWYNGAKILGLLRPFGDIPQEGEIAKKWARFRNFDENSERHFRFNPKPRGGRGSWLPWAASWRRGEGRSRQWPRQPRGPDPGVSLSSCPGSRHPGPGQADERQEKKSVFRIHDILVRIRIRGSMPLTNGSGSCYFRHWPSRRQQKN